MTDLVYATAHDVTSLEPTQASGWADHTATLAIFGALMFNFDGSNGKVGYWPYLASEVRARDPLSWAVRLRPGLTFHNGEPLDAQALKFSIDRIQKPDFPSRRFFHSAPIERVEVEDELTCVIHTSEPIAILPARLLRADAYPVAPSAYGPDPATSALTPVGAGPFRFVSYEKGDRLVLSVFGGFSDPRGLARPNFDRLVMRVITDPKTLVHEMAAGRIDIAPLSVDQVEAFSAIEGVRVVSAPDTSRMSFEINQKAHPALADRRVRQAINLAIDVDALCERLTGGAGRPIATLVNPPNADPALTPYGYDVRRARTLLAEAGYGDGFAIEIDWSTSPDRGQIAEALVPYLEAVGIAVTAVNDKDWAGAYQPQQVEGTLGGLHAHGHAGVEMTAETDLWPIHPGREANSTNWQGRAAERFVALYTELQKAVEPAEQERLGNALQAIVHEEAISVPLWQLPRYVALGPRVERFNPYPGGHNEDFWAVRMVEG
ncbi:ABC transporter substrate-binding protein [Pelagibacterium montanilacus]|uniref:ABC transporter substrate-binding protein n=1 Tax=Pelagibacterium montanilacus TaxID=2185280 RepID=UPI000F8E87D9|nr:ABC transporter substrate-binding protein [Pelagibacterium montanilacus]